MKRILILMALMALMVACGDDDAGAVVEVTEAPGDNVGYGDGDLVVVIDGDSYVVEGEYAEEDCVQIGEHCVPLNQLDADCKDENAQMDVVVVEGEVVEVICYPPEDESVSVEEVVVTEEGKVTVPQNQGHVVLGFPEDTNGEPIEGDVVIDSEHTALYGNGVDETILDGNVTVASNHSNVRSLTVDGDVNYTNNSNNSTLAFCKITGNLVVESNGFVGLECQVFGDVQVTGNDAHLINIGVGGEWEVGGARCEGCYSFDDGDEDGVVADEERGEAIECQ